VKFMMTLFMTVVAILILAKPAHAGTLQDDVDTMLGTMKTVYSAYYAPADWKKTYAGYDLNTSYNDALAQASSKTTKLTIQQSRVIFKDFIYAMKDYHTSVSFTSTETSTLPLTVRGAEGRLFIVAIDRTKLSETAFPFNVGDELLTVDGKSANQTVSELQDYFAANAAATDRATAEMRLFKRSAARGFTQLPQGPVMLGIRRAGETATSTVQLIWDYTPELIAPRTDFLNAKISHGTRRSIFNPMMDVPFDLAGDSDANDPYSLGSHTSFMPNLGARIWESAKDSEFDSYIYMNDDHKLIGYVRIPSYVPGNTMKAVAEFKATIARMQQMTDSLVIDQVNNPGGSVFYLYSLVSFLSDQPMSTPRHKMAIAQVDVQDALSTLNQLKDIKTEDDLAKLGDAANEIGGGYPVTLEFVQFMRSYAQFIISEWTAGRRLTNPYWIGGVDHINPNAVHYTKPILLLVNELDFSGGDFFPSTMQDNKRVTVMGTRTAGAGGYVNDVTVPNNVGVASFRVTQSIAERAGGNPIENLGCVPEIPYAMTAADYQSNYAGYVSAVKAAIKKITP
jgi:C-terminal processing protease CtpA/Prc